MHNTQAPARNTATTTGPIDLERLGKVPGWFSPLDQMLVRLAPRVADVARHHRRPRRAGRLQGKSAILIGAHLQQDETLIVCDLFGRPASEEEIGADASQFYRDRLCRQDFETNYLSFIEELPRIVEGPSSTILQHVRPGRVRFVHIDAAHRYSNVRQDIAAARTMLREDGVVVLDDFRTAHTPGVAAAVWGAVLRDGLVPLCVSETKFYGRGVLPARCSTNCQRGSRPGSSRTMNTTSRVSR